MPLIFQHIATQSIEAFTESKNARSGTVVIVHVEDHILEYS
jgi:hypothetical protein